ncbi:MAG: transcription termination factor NusA [Cycloclasticus pugetii]|jgi:N utilization substance protein A|uniref:Transcription termination/antitermination protein NusA n=2 Tax=Cycloclasticus TaxID=34067 RepID=S5T6S0_9GAMM|nr:MULTISPECIES: transcription termination factor NusA [Cycloclasticus]AFT67614.1 transcription elongation factor NusA [Cycloclasticus sp. P1]AGS39214.1 Transcription termination factor NusA [Cycloclasticus zancles 78-ME]ATI02841.1 transcription termination/antitermination protein NusA [Cycloclasticus sp. PY97N]EPD13586.1 transcription elongation factor NusA [Cycloclasticus pugetii]MDF1828435.1 transcription termination factor NusA [Cycloclasticus pugetii]
MANKEILMVVDVVSNEKEIDRSVLFEAIEAALEMATKKLYRDDIAVRVAIDRVSGDYESFRQWEVVEADPEFENGLENPDAQILLEDAQKKDPTLEVGSFIEEPIESADFGRIGAQAAKQVIVQKVREAERRKVYELYKDKVGELVTGVIKRIERGNVFVDLEGTADAIIPREEMIPREPVRTGDRIRGYLKSVEEVTRGPQLTVSRSAPELLTALFKLEVPEVGDGLIEILGAARDPGSRAKIAVRTRDQRLDPVGACVGMRGSRVQAVSNELAGERVDIILWDENEAQFVINAMSPAEVVAIVVDEDKHSMDVSVKDDSLSQAIGRGGQNVRLASELTGWKLNVMSETQADEQNSSEADGYAQQLMLDLDVDEDVALILVQEGYTSIEEINFADLDDLTDIEEFDEDIAEELQQRAKDAYLIKAIASEEVLEEHEPAKDLLNMEGMDRELAFKLASKEIVTMEDLANLATDELLEIASIDEERATTLIMKAREPWFAE